MIKFKTTNGGYETLDPLSITKSASLAAIGLHLVLARWSAQSLSDGFLPLYVVDQLGTEELFDELVASGVWTRTEDGFHIADWHDEQEAAETVLAKREAAAERVRRHRAKMAGTAVVEEAEAIVAEAEGVDVEGLAVEPEKPAAKAPVAAAERTRAVVSSKVPEVKNDGSDLSFDEYLDLMETPPDDDQACWDAWLKANRICYASDILDAADDYQSRVPRRQRLLPEEWLNTEEYLRCAPFNTPVEFPELQSR